jgi:hypothetical protein
MESTGTKGRDAIGKREPTAYERLEQEYTQSAEPFAMLTHPYFSTGAFPFDVVATEVDAQGFTRAVLKCLAGTHIDLFSYAINDPGQSAGLPNAVPATDAETNLMERHQTNNEDFAIEGVSLHARGVRVEYPAIGATIWDGDSGFHDAIRLGQRVINDPGAELIPPEVCSPLVLQDTLLTAIRAQVSVEPRFDRKAGDHMARLDKFPEGGANSFLLANGGPDHHNFFRLHEGFVWRKSNSQTDKLFELKLTCENDVYMVVTIPNIWISGTAADSVGALKRLWLELTIFLHGRAFFYPSKNQ